MIADFTPNIDQKVEKTKLYLTEVKLYAEQYLKEHKIINDKNEFNLQNYNSNEQNKNETKIAIDQLSQQFKEYDKLMNMFVDNNTYEKQTQEDLLNAYLGVGLSTQTGTRFSMAIDLKNFSDNPSQAIKEFLEKTDTTGFIQILDAIKDKTSYTKL